MQSKFSKHLTGFRKNHSTQNALLVIIEKWKTIFNKKLNVGALFIDLSKAFDTLDQSLFLAKLSVYGFDNNSLSFVRSYLTNRIQRCKIENHFSNWREITTGVPQGSILSMTFSYSLKFQTFVIMPMLTVYLHLEKLLTKLPELQNDFLILDEWFINNFLVLNSDKCHFMTLETPNTLPNFKCKNIIIKNSVSEKLLGVIINTVCKKANLKLYDLNRISRFLSPDQHVLKISAYIKSLFSYCPLVRMFCYRRIMHKTNKIHERSLRLLLKNYKDDFQDLLRSSGDISIHQRCISSLLTEV